MESGNKKEWTASAWAIYHSKLRAFDELNDALARGDKQKITRLLETPTMAVQNIPDTHKWASAIQEVNFRTHPKTIHVLWLLFASNPVYMHHPTEVQSSICTSNWDGKSVRKLWEFPEIDRLHMEWEVGRWCAEGWYGCDLFTWTDEFQGTYLASLQDLAGISDDDAWMWVMAWIHKILWSRIESSAQRPSKEETTVFYWCEFVCSGDHFGTTNKRQIGDKYAQR